jgi:DNA-binding SARP family transcriptional activator
MVFEARRRLLEGLVMALDGQDGAPTVIASGATLAAEQGAELWARYGTTLLALARSTSDPSTTVVGTAQDNPVVLSMLAEAVLERLPDLSAKAQNMVEAEAANRPWRWREATRRVLDRRSTSHSRAAAQLLEKIGERDDVQRLRDASRTMRDRALARLALDLARRLADPVFVEDLGRVRISIGARGVDGGEVRRKVLALLCLLLTKPRLSSTRDEVIEALWPDQDPPSALNSLNQTVYFLRRVFEANYHEETSPGYVGQDGETIWLDAELVTSSSRECSRLVRSMPKEPSPEDSVALATMYSGRFALDFAYEDWAGDYRDALHAAYLRVMERAIRMDIDTGQFGRGTFLAERAAEVEPDAEEIQAALVRLYRMSGAHAAAAEQYEHYAESMRELGVEPVPFTDV